ncbi:MAG: hypothetical protein LBS43_07475 [Prevotellaceae bacterium]|nr:hypothetical protein [Prevotellaceae bacterium]
MIIDTKYNHKAVAKAIVAEFKKRGVAEATSNNSNTTTTSYYKVKHKGVTFDFRFSSHSQWSDDRADATPDSEVVFEEIKITFVHISTDELEPKKADIIGFMNWVEIWNSENHDSRPDFDYMLEKSKHNPLFRIMIKKELIEKISGIQREKAEREKAELPILKEIDAAFLKIAKFDVALIELKKEDAKVREKISADDLRKAEILNILPINEFVKDFDFEYKKINGDEIQSRAFSKLNDLQKQIDKNEEIKLMRVAQNNSIWGSRSFDPRLENEEYKEDMLKKYREDGEKEFISLSKQYAEQEEYYRLKEQAAKEFEKKIDDFGREKYNSLQKELDEIEKYGRQPLPSAEAKEKIAKLKEYLFEEYTVDTYSPSHFWTFNPTRGLIEMGAKYVKRVDAKHGTSDYDFFKKDVLSELLPDDNKYSELAAKEDKAEKKAILSASTEQDKIDANSAFWFEFNTRMRQILSDSPDIK